MTLHEVGGAPSAIGPSCDVGVPWCLNDENDSTLWDIRLGERDTSPSRADVTQSDHEKKAQWRKSGGASKEDAPFFQNCLRNFTTYNMYIYIYLRREGTKASLCFKGGGLRASLAPPGMPLGQGRVGG